VADAAVIFDVDGVLLELTRDEEELFFEALSRFVPTENLSRDWNSYRIRNDEDIIVEILERNSLPVALKSTVTAHYMALIMSSKVRSKPIIGASTLLKTLSNEAHLGIATANLLCAAKHRLQQADFWNAVSSHASGADGGGHKSVILGRTITGLPPVSKVIYIGDNINDLEAARVHGVTFIGFSEDALRRDILRTSGAKHISATHLETRALINQMLA
jgi:phosphoglycolate phosphatase-like HAD superfamily hydrolase